MQVAGQIPMLVSIMYIHGEPKKRTRHLPSNREHHNPSGDSSDEELRLCSREAIKKSVKYYLQNSSLHGLKYLAEERITIPERCVVNPTQIYISILYENY